MVPGLAMSVKLLVLCLFEGFTSVVAAPPISPFYRCSWRWHVSRGMEVAILVLHVHRAVVPRLDDEDGGFCTVHVSRSANNR